MSGSVIEFRKVSFSYRTPAGTGHAPVGVSGVDMLVEPGKCVLVCGASGCGKTTVTRLANGLAPSFFPGDMSGRVLVDGRDVDSMESWEVAERVGSVFQNPRTQFFNVDSTGEVAFALESLSWPEERLRSRVRETIEELDLCELADRNIFSLSGGEKQRIAYASVWAPHPGSLVLDEPTSNLDADAIADLRRYLLDAKGKGTAVLVAEHRLWWLMDVVDEIVAMEGGRIVRRMDVDEFRSLSVGELHAMGLRASDLTTVHACGNSGKRLLRPPLLSLRDVRAAYGKDEVLRGVDLDLRSGEVTALVGSNGAGKSTLSRTLCGLHRESAGTVCMEGSQARPQERLQACSLVFQDVNYQLFGDSVQAEVGFGLVRDDVPSPERVKRLLGDLGLDDFADRHPATLSGGQKQRLAVAACIASGKRVLVFDEPTSGLDLNSMEAVAGLVRRLADSGRAVLVVTHDLEFIARACDRTVLLERGMAVADVSVEGDLSDVRALLSRDTRG